MKSTFLKYFFFPFLFLLVFQGEGRGEVRVTEKIPIKTDIVSNFGAKIQANVDNILAAFPIDETHQFYQKLVGRADEIHEAILDNIGDIGLRSVDDLTQFFDDIAAAGEELMEAFATNPNLIKAWDFVVGCPSVTRLNNAVLENLSIAIQREAKNLDEIVTHANHPAITNKTVQHIFRGDSGGGRHHISAILDDNARRLVDRLEETSEGFYGAVFSSGGRKSFWPDSWDEFKIMDELKYVLNNNPSNIPGTNIWNGNTQSGQLIEYYLHADGHIISAFPKLTNFP